MGKFTRHTSFFKRSQDYLKPIMPILQKKNNYIQAHKQTG